MTNLHGYSHRLAKFIHGDKIQTPGAQFARIKMLVAADHDLLVGAIYLNHIERRSGRNPKALALSHGEVVNAAVLTDHLSTRGYQLTRSLGEGLAALAQISIDETLVVAAGNKTNFLRVGLLRQRQTVRSGTLTHLELGHFTQREKRAAKLLLSKAEEEIGLILAAIGGTFEQPASANVVILHASVVAGGHALPANLPSHDE